MKFLIVKFVQIKMNVQNALIIYFEILLIKIVHVFNVYF